MFARVAVINRGEPAIRLFRAVRELNEERGYGIKVIAFHTESEQRALFVRSADEAVCLHEGGTSSSPYLDRAELERALRVSRADAVWVGWGFVAEDPAFAELYERMGLVFIGPPAQAMRQLGDKIEAKLLAARTGVPIAAWSGGPVLSPEDAIRQADAIGFPLVIKARSGGGGRGIRVVRSAEELMLAFERTQAEAGSTFGDPVVFIESSSAVGATSRCRSSPTPTARSGLQACATARSSGATRSWSKSPAPRCSASNRSPSYAGPRSRWYRPPATAVPARSSTCTSRPTRPSPSWR